MAVRAVLSSMEGLARLCGRLLRTGERTSTDMPITGVHYPPAFYLIANVEGPIVRTSKSMLCFFG